VKREDCLYRNQLKGLYDDQTLAILNAAMTILGNFMGKAADYFANCKANRISLKFGYLLFIAKKFIKIQ